MKMRWLLVTGVLALAVLVALLLLRSSKLQQGALSPKTHVPAPDFTLPQIGGGNLTLSSYRGKVVLLDFWATWCDPCRLEIPWFIDLQRKNKDRGFEVLGVSMDDEGWEV